MFFTVIRGRVRVQLKKDDGEPLIEQFPTRDAIISHVAEMIPQLKSRTSKPSSGASGNNESQQHVHVMYKCPFSLAFDRW